MHFSNLPDLETRIALFSPVDHLVSGLPVIHPELRNLESLVSALFGE